MLVIHQKAVQGKETPIAVSLHIGELLETPSRSPVLSAVNILATVGATNKGRGSGRREAVVAGELQRWRVVDWRSWWCGSAGQPAVLSSMSSRRAHPTRRPHQERLASDYFIERERRPVEALDGINLLIEIECHASSQVAAKKLWFYKYFLDLSLGFREPSHFPMMLSSTEDNWIQRKFQSGSLRRLRRAINNLIMDVVYSGHDGDEVMSFLSHFCIDVPMPNVNVNVALEREPEQYVDIPVVLKSECLELPFPPNLIGRLEGSIGRVPPQSSQSRRRPSSRARDVPQSSYAEEMRPRPVPTSSKHLSTQDYCLPGLGSDDMSFVIVDDETIPKLDRITPESWANNATQVHS
ncbi:hypothetical protein Cgig2_008908 [Carnegiea gigantea]|uniref:Uncharacterized protein n=1 Tax=Carnegiea gigantea TaxID=171969 RepID=A0A9Q1GHW0_9CARY|nr:hypothetical protein Cgig2_008908 [Carnegiea gigantea]